MRVRIRLEGFVARGELRERLIGRDNGISKLFARGEDNIAVRHFPPRFLFLAQKQMHKDFLFLSVHRLLEKYNFSISIFSASASVSEEIKSAMPDRRPPNDKHF